MRGRSFGRAHFLCEVGGVLPTARVVSGSCDNAVRIWDAASGECVVGPLDGHTSYVLSVAFSPDGTRVVSGSYDKTVRIWDAASGECVVVGPLDRHTSYVNSVAFSPDGTRVVSGSRDNTVRIAGCGVGRVRGRSFGRAH